MVVDREPQEPKVKKTKLPVINFWKQDQVIGEIEVSSGPLPTHDELPPQEPGQEEERPASPTYPTTRPPREDVPQGGTPRGDL
ncbi:MAG: hypothetical protein AAB875_02280 [Patescibacteria group bacterium]